MLVDRALVLVQALALVLVQALVVVVIVIAVVIAVVIVRLFLFRGSHPQRRCRLGQSSEPPRLFLRRPVVEAAHTGVHVGAPAAGAEFRKHEVVEFVLADLAAFHIPIYAFLVAWVQIIAYILESQTLVCSGAALVIEVYQDAAHIEYYSLYHI